MKFNVTNDLGEANLQTEFIDLVPVLACSDIAAAHDFLVHVLGFASGGLEHAPDGTVVHGEVLAGERRIWLHLTSETAKLATPATLGAAGGGIVVYVKDVDAHFEVARRAGATILREPADQPYGQREYAVRDPDGHSWWIATPSAAPEAVR
jgi:PhnB protein